MIRYRFDMLTHTVRVILGFFPGIGVRVLIGFVHVIDVPRQLVFGELSDGIAVDVWI